MNKGWATRLPNGVVVYTFVGDIPRSLLAQLRTHQRISQIPIALSAQSSRAVPIDVMLDTVPKFVPKFRKGAKGMKTSGLVSQEKQERLECLWAELEGIVEKYIENVFLVVEPDLSKGQLNRLLEPFRMVRVAMTAPVGIWHDFWELRCSEDAQDEMQDFANMTKVTFENLEPEAKKVHIPFDAKDIYEAVVFGARVSFRSDSKKGVKARYEQLSRDAHWGPFEHVVYPLENTQQHFFYDLCGRFVGYDCIPLRSYLEVRGAEWCRKNL